MGNLEIANLLKLIPDGLSVIAVIVVMVLFLKQQDKQSNAISELMKNSNDAINVLADKSNDAMNALMEKFNSVGEKNRQAYTEHIINLSHQNTENQKNYQDQIQQMLQSHFKVSKEQIEALKTLENTMSILNSQFTIFMGNKH